MPITQITQIYCISMPKIIISEKKICEISEICVKISTLNIFSHADYADYADL